MSYYDYDEYRCHIICLGDIGTGKTTLTQSYVRGKYQAAETQRITRLSVEFDSKVIFVNNKRLKIFLWDTARQETFYLLRAYFYKGKDVILIAYDVNNRRSFDSARHCWYEQVKTYCSGRDGKRIPIIILVGNKSDTDEKRQVSYEEGVIAANDLSIPFFETSAKTMDGVDELFNFCARVHIKQSPKMIKKSSSFFARMINCLIFC